MLKNIILLTALSLTVGACAMGQVKPEQKASLKKIGVYAALGNQMNYDHIGTTIFTNNLQHVTFDSGLDDAIAQSAVVQLTAKGYQAHVLKPPVFQATPGVEPEELAVVQKLAQAEGDNAILFITPGTIPDEGNAGHLRTGYGFVNTNTFGMEHTYLYVLITASLTDLQAGKPMGWSKGYSSLTGAPAMKDYAQLTWTANFETIPQDQKTIMAKDLAYLADTAITYAIPDMGL